MKIAHRAEDVERICVTVASLRIEELAARMARWEEHLKTMQDEYKTDIARLAEDIAKRDTEYKEDAARRETQYKADAARREAYAARSKAYAARSETRLMLAMATIIGLAVLILKLPP